MTTDAKRVLDAALDLPTDERRRLIGLLQESLAEEASQQIEAAWIAEAKRRLEDVESGRTIPVSSEDTKAKRLDILERARERRAG